MTTGASSLVKEKAPLILAEIKKANSILLHCHPSPDPDSVGSGLAMKYALEQLGKKATLIKGDSDIPQAFMHFPGAQGIVMKNFWEIDQKEFDLFIVLDATCERVSQIKPVEFSPHLNVVNIDHHKTNVGCGSVSLIDPSYAATAHMLFDIFKEIGVTITPEIAANLFIGMYTDTGGFKYSGVTPATYVAAAELISIYPDFDKLISTMENSNTLDDLTFQGLALSAIEIVCDGKIALSSVPYSLIQKKKLADSSVGAGIVSSILRTMGEFEVVGAIIEIAPQEIKASFRACNSDTYDVSKLAASLGGGGHKAAAGAVLRMPLSDAKKLVVSKIKELYNL